MAQAAVLSFHKDRVSLHPEFDLLCACCAECPEGERLRLVREFLDHPLDWLRLVEAAEHHGVIPQVHDNLSKSSGTIPAETMANIRQLYELNVRRTLWLTRELGRILASFRSHGIDALPYKGPVLAESLYGNVAARQFCDLDILIHDRDLSRARTALLELGFEVGMRLTPREERAYLRSGYELSFGSANGQNLVEVQWQIMPRFYAMGFDVDKLFERSCLQTVAEMEVRSLANEDLLLVLCAHAAKHAWIQLSWLRDVAQLAEQATLDWESVMRRAARMGLRRIVGVTFALAHRLLGASMPDSLRPDQETEACADRVLPLIEASAHFETESMKYFHLIASGRERGQDRLRFWWRLATTPSVGEWTSVQLPSTLFPLYRVIRPLRLARRLFQSF